jgi:hypothetical protein
MGLESFEVFNCINKKTYLQLRRSGRIGEALLSMCVLVIKYDKDGNPERAKSRIVLVNFEDRIYEKSQRYTPVLRHLIAMANPLTLTPSQLRIPKIPIKSAKQNAIRGLWAA